jgi:hypothetical protein
VLNQLVAELRTKDLERQQRLARLQTDQPAVGSQGGEQVQAGGQRPPASASIRRRERRAVRRAQLVARKNQRKAFRMLTNVLPQAGDHAAQLQAKFPSAPPVSVIPNTAADRLHSVPLKHSRSCGTGQLRSLAFSKLTSFNNT